MRVFRAPEEVPADFGPSAVTVGKFDGVHSGHRAIIGNLLEAAASQSLASVVVTFDRHPLALLAPEKCPPSLVSIDQKLELLAETGVDAVLLLPFDSTLAALSAEDFVRKILVERLHARVVLVGADFRFGARGAGTVQLLTDLAPANGYTVRLIDDVRPEGSRRVSSTWIRQLLGEGDVAHAAAILGHLPTVRGIVVEGAKRGRELGFPTANLAPESQGLIPEDGVYAGWLTDGGTRYPAAVSVGNNPTFQGVAEKQVEAYVLDRELDLYGHEVDVAFVQRIRGMVEYSGIEPLIAQIAKDVEQVRGILSSSAV